MFLRALATKPPVVDREFLDQVEEKASQMVDLMQDLGETHLKKREMKQTVKRMDRRKFLDEMEEKASQMEDLMQDLGETHSKKREQLQEIKQTIKWMDPEEMEILFDLAARQKQELRDQLTEIQRSLVAAKSNFAVDAPDGESDGHLEEEMDAVQHILEEHVAHVEQEKKCTTQRTAPNEWMSG